MILTCPPLYENYQIIKDIKDSPARKLKNKKLDYSIRVLPGLAELCCICSAFKLELKRLICWATKCANLTIPFLNIFLKLFSYLIK